MAAKRAATLDSADLAILREEAYDLDHQGYARVRPYFGRIEPLIRFSFRLFGQARGVAFMPSYSDRGWEAVRGTIAVRNRVTHPKRVTDLKVSRQEVETASAAIIWFVENQLAITNMIREKLEQDSTQVEPDAEGSPQPRRCTGRLTPPVNATAIRSGKASFEILKEHTDEPQGKEGRAMKPWEQKIVPVGLGVAGLVFLIAAVKPTFAGGGLHVTFFLVGLACAVLAVAAWRRSHGTPGS